MSKTAELATMFSSLGGPGLERITDQMERRAAVARCVVRMQAVARQHGGTFIKAIGDVKQMWTYPNANAAWAAGLEMSETVSLEFSDIHMNAGFQFGAVIREPGDVFGDSVNSAARLADLARGGQLLTSRETLDVIGEHVLEEFRFVDSVAAKGKAEMMDVYEALGDQDDITVSGSEAQRARALGAQVLVITHAGGEFRMTPASPQTTIGKAPENDIVVDDPKGRVSRLAHASLEFIGKSYTLIDRSTNGTIVERDGGSPEFLRRDQVLLRGAGRIVVGADTDPAPATVLHYEVRELKAG